METAPPVTISLPSPRQILAPLEKRSRKLPPPPVADLSKVLKDDISIEEFNFAEMEVDDGAQFSQSSAALSEAPDDASSSPSTLPPDMLKIKSLVHNHLVNVLNTAGFDEVR